MAIIKAVSSHAPIETAIDYVGKREKTEGKLLTGIGISPDTAKEEMKATKELYGKAGGRTYKHFVQSFAPEEKITLDQAHAIACKLAEKCKIFQGYEILIATHKDRDHIHTHFIVNSVGYETGRKFQMSARDLQAMKDLSDSICRDYGLSICKKGRTFSGEERSGIIAWTKEKYQYLQKSITGKASKSYVMETAIAVRDAMNMAESREEFLSILAGKGYCVDWQEKHKYITFTDQAGNKVRDANLNKTFNLGVGKAELIGIFKENAICRENLQGVARRLESYRALAVGSEYRVKSYMEVKQEIDKKVRSRQLRAEAIGQKINNTALAIKEIKNQVRKWTAEKKRCQVHQLIKKHDLQGSIDHGNAKIESLMADRDRFLHQYGFNTVEQAETYIKDLQEAEKFSLQLQESIIHEQREKESAIQKYEFIEDQCKENPGIGMEREKFRETCMNDVRKDLKEFFKDNFSEQGFEMAARRIDRKLSGETISTQKKESVLAKLERHKKEIDSQKGNEIQKPKRNQGRNISR